MSTREYQCDLCKASGIKLWRKYQVMASCTDLICAKCLAPDLTIDCNGTYKNSDGVMTDQIGSYVPAVPVDNTFYGYTSVPDDKVNWWKSLSTYK